jgi:hypothetical protein
MVILWMQVLTFFMWLVSAHSPSGSMIIYFSVFYDAISMITTVIAALCTTYCVVSPVVRLAVVFGSKVTPSMMDTLKLSAKTASFRYVICHPSQFAHQKTCSTIAILKTSICYLPCLGYHGSYLKTFTSIFKSFSLVCSGTSLVSPLGWEMPRKLNIWLLLWNCPLSKHMSFSISSNYMGSCYMPVSSSLLDEHILPHWRPCLAPPVHVHLCHITPIVTSMTISPGGQNNFPDQSSKEPSPNLALSLMYVPTLMPAPASVSQLLLMGFGMPGLYHQIGAPSMVQGTLDGLKLWALSCSSDTSIFCEVHPALDISRYIVTTPELLMDGRMVGVGTGRLTACLDTCYPSLMTRTPSPLSTLIMFQVEQIRLTSLPMGSSLLPHISCHPLSSPMLFTDSYTMFPPSLLANITPAHNGTQVLSDYMTGTLSLPSLDRHKQLDTIVLFIVSPSFTPPVHFLH